MTKLFAIFGSPVIHSKSPILWNAIFSKLNIDAHYFRINPGRVQNIVSIIKELNLSGANITAPYKEEIIQFLDEVDESAKKIGAVNTVLNSDGKLKGFNTDYVGVVKSLESILGVNKISNLNSIVILGAGGASRACIYGLQSAGAKKITIINRTPSKAQELAKDFSCNFSKHSLTDIEKNKSLLVEAEVVISCVPAELNFDLNILKKGAIFFNANYAHSNIKESNPNIKYLHGSDWLVNQAVPAFKILTGYQADAVFMSETLSKSEPKKHKSISLIGFMGTGKTSLGKMICKLKKYKFIDTDKLIVESEKGEQINDIFKNKGEKYFRSLEEETFLDLEIQDGVVISTGGGCVKNPKIVNKLKSNSTVVWLFNSLKTSIERDKAGGASTRPILNNKSEQEIDALFEERKFLYAKACDIMYYNEKVKFEDLAEYIANEND